MSKTIDEKVVEMKFDNSNFEANVKTTMSTLDKFKSKLNLSGASKGLEEINTEVKKFDAGGIITTLSNVNQKFSAMEIVGITALTNITNSAIEMGKGLLKSMTIDPITTGWSKLSEKTASVQTLMNATGKSIDEVNKYLDKLTWYADETSYGFTDMTSALAQMASSGRKC